MNYCLYLLPIRPLDIASFPFLPYNGFISTAMLKYLRKEEILMQKEEIALQITLKLLDNFTYKTEEYGGNTLSEHAIIASDVASTIFNNLYEKLKTE